MNSKWKIEPVSLLEKAMQSVAVNISCQLYFITFPLDTDQKVLAAETAMSRAFRAASVGKGSTAVSVDGQVFVSLQFLSLSKKQKI